MTLSKNVLALCVALWSIGAYAIPTSYIATSSQPATATLATDFKVRDESKDRPKSDRADYCVIVAIHNKGSNDVHAWRLMFNLGADKLVSMEHGKPDKNTGAIVVAPIGGHQFIKSGHDRTIKFCASIDRAHENVPLRVSIVSPLTGTMLQTDKLLVSGTYGGPPGSGVSINGVVALTDGHYFYANDVPLVQGSNTIEAVVTSPLGRTAKHTIEVRSIGAAAVLELYPSSSQGGIAPLPVRFQFEFTGVAAIRSIAMDFDGNGVTDFSTTNPNELIAYTYNVPGIFLAKVTLIDTLGVTYRTTRAVRVYHDQSLDTLFNGVFSEMNNALLLGHIDRALLSMSVASRDRYRPVYLKLKNRFPAIMSSYSPLQRSRITGRFGEYAVNRVIDGVNRIFLIYFVQDDDGVWRIDSM